MHLDCDQDALLIIAQPTGPICHKGSESCFSYELEKRGFFNYLEGVIDEKIETISEESYVSRLTRRGKSYVAQKVGEEGVEVAIASAKNDQEEIRQESADLLFHMLVNLRVHRLSLDDVVNILKQRNRKK